MADLGTAYVQIVPSAQGIKGSIEKSLGGEAASAGKKAGNSIVGAIKGAIVAAGIGKIVADAMSAGGALEQAYGGLETIYGDAAAAAKQYAEAAAQAGISANSYAEQAVSFGAALKQAGLRRNQDRDGAAVGGRGEAERRQVRHQQPGRCVRGHSCHSG